MPLDLIALFMSPINAKIRQMIPRINPIMQKMFLLSLDKPINAKIIAIMPRIQPAKKNPIIARIIDTIPKISAFDAIF